MPLEDIMEENEEIEVEGPKVEYENKEYDVYITNNRLIFFRRKGFIRRSDDFAFWNLKNVEGVKMEKMGSGGVVSTGGEALLVDLGKEEIKFKCQAETSRLLAKLRARIE